MAGPLPYLLFRPLTRQAGRPDLPAYRSKYRHYAARTLDRITSPQARSTTSRVRPE